VKAAQSQVILNRELKFQRCHGSQLFSTGTLVENGRMKKEKTKFV